MLPNKDLDQLNSEFSDLSQFLQASYMQRKIEHFGFASFMDELPNGEMNIILPLENGMVIRISPLKVEVETRPFISFSTEMHSSEESLFTAKFELLSFECEEGFHDKEVAYVTYVEASISRVNQEFPGFLLGGIYDLVLQSQIEIYPCSNRKKMAI